MTKPKNSSIAKNMTHHAGTWNGNDVEERLADVVESRGKITLPDPKDLTDAELVEEIVEKINAAAGRKYVEGVDVCQKGNFCLGADAKMQKGEFTRDNLEAHKKAAEMFGEHRGLAEAVKIIRAVLEAALSAERVGNEKRKDSKRNDL